MCEPDGQAFSDRMFAAEDGLHLHLRDYHPGPDATGSRLPVICLAGLTRNARDFHQLALIISQDARTPRRVIALDYRGRGLSDRDDNKANYTVLVEARDVIHVCAGLGVDRAIFIGTSRGGLILHMLAAIKPDLLAAVVLNDIGPVIEAKGLMQIRDDLNSAIPPRDWNDATKMLQARHGADFPALGEQDWVEMADAIYRETDGRIVADVDPAIAAQLMTIDFENPLPDLWSQFDALANTPKMVIRGEHSPLLSETTVEEMMARHAGAQRVWAPEQGHPPLLHLQPVANAIKAFLASV
jgi:pimeloyl-ACP methyl ester carboxylesterase